MESTIGWIIVKPVKGLICIVKEIAMWVIEVKGPDIPVSYFAGVKRDLVTDKNLAMMFVTRTEANLAAKPVPGVVSVYTKKSFIR
tara:strand:+ start:1019 stop:1273 length:255 start_codon:yes stop_codon:yes gene_type:complete